MLKDPEAKQNTRTDPGRAEKSEAGLSGAKKSIRRHLLLTAGAAVLVAAVIFASTAAWYERTAKTGSAGFAAGTWDMDTTLAPEPTTAPITEEQLSAALTVLAADQIYIDALNAAEPTEAQTALLAAYIAAEALIGNEPPASQESITTAAQTLSEAYATAGGSAELFPDPQDQGDPGNQGNQGDPDNPGNQGDPDNPGNQGDPDNPGNQENPENPNNPVNPNSPENPDNPEQPQNP